MKKIRFKEGDLVEITGNSNRHDFKIGELVRFTEEEGTIGFKCWNFEGDDYWWVELKDIKHINNNMKETIEVKGKKYEECDWDGYAESRNTLSVEVDGRTSYCYKEVKEEFETRLNCIDGMYAISEDKEGVLKVGCKKIRVEDIETLLKEYKEWKES